MRHWQVIALRWPDRLFELRRRCSIDPDFCQVISDYQEASIALDHWRSRDPATSERVADYQRLVNELEAEIERNLKPR